MTIKLSKDHYIIQWPDGSINIENDSDRFENLEWVTLEQGEQIKLRDYLLQKFPLTNDTESKGA